MIKTLMETFSYVQTYRDNIENIFRPLHKERSKLKSMKVTYNRSHVS